MSEDYYGSINQVPLGKKVVCNICMKRFSHSTDVVLHVIFEHPVEYLKARRIT